jgi:anti-anti-sigma regulatory factor
MEGAPPQPPPSMVNEAPPEGFRAVAYTAPPQFDAASLEEMLRRASDVMARLQDFAGHRIIFARQIETADSSTVATLIQLASRATAQGHEFVIVDPPKVLDMFLDIYLPGTDRDQRIFYSQADEPSVCRVPWVPKFRASTGGRIDVYEGQLTASYSWTETGFEQA